MNTNRLKHYLPAVFLLLGAWFFILVPGLAVALIAGGLASAGLLYGWLVYRFHRAQAEAGSVRFTRFEEDLSSRGGPSFKNVTVTVLKKGEWFSREGSTGEHPRDSGPQGPFH